MIRGILLGDKKRKNIGNINVLVENVVDGTVKCGTAYTGSPMIGLYVLAGKSSEGPLKLEIYCDGRLVKSWDDLTAVDITVEGDISRIEKLSANMTGYPYSPKERTAEVECYGEVEVWRPRKGSIDYKWGHVEIKIL